MVTDQQQQEETEYLSASFRIDPERLAAQGRSLQLLLLHRRCASCWGTLVQEPAEGRDITVAEHLKQISSHCSSAPDFLRPEFPVMEAVFRILLTNGTQPMTVQSIYEALRERWSNLTNPRTPSTDKLYRMLQGDAFYGISEVSQAAEG